MSDKWTEEYSGSWKVDSGWQEMISSCKYMRCHPGSLQLCAGCPGSRTCILQCHCEPMSPCWVKGMGQGVREYLVVIATTSSLRELVAIQDMHLLLSSVKTFSDYLCIKQPTYERWLFYCESREDKTKYESWIATRCRKADIVRTDNVECTSWIPDSLYKAAAFRDDKPMRGRSYSLLLLLPILYPLFSTLFFLFTYHYSPITPMPLTLYPDKDSRLSQ